MFALQKRVVPPAWASTRTFLSWTQSTTTPNRSEKRETGKPNSPKNSVPDASPGSRLDELMHHPLLFDPIRKPRLPIVLCHGLYGFDVRGPFLGLEYHYWSATLDLLRNRVGAKVYVHGVPPTGSIQERAESLHQFLCKQGFEPGQKLNLIAHSMGGLDARHIITHIQPKEYTVASLTTLSTPHRGSPFMDWCNTNIGVGLDLIDDMMSDVTPSKTIETPPATAAPFSLKSPLFVREKPVKEAVKKEAENVIVKTLGKMSNSLSSYILSVFDQPAYAMLSTRYMNHLFNPSTPDMPGVRYFSIAARTPEISVLHPLWLPKLILDKAAETGTCGGESDGSSKALGTELEGNDGLVSVPSAQWGEFLGVMENWDHWDIRGPGGPHRIRLVNSEKEESNLGKKWSALTSTVLSWFPQRRKRRSPPQVDENWDWRDAMLSQYEDSTSKQAEKHDVPAHAAAYALSSGYDRCVDPKEESQIADRLASWISSHLPARAKDEKREGDMAPADEKRDETDSRMLLAYLTMDRPSTPAFAPDGWLESLGDSRAAKMLRKQVQATKEISRMARFSSAALEMFPFLINAGNKGKMPSKETFDRFWLAVCRNLYEEGL
ncbi:triglyceride lipase [Malassezia pachydermatis]|uniref:GPI inositol-deacylase n=1 Tax=Malassezia pachydermatis TaxID=77020 RepID=A0A0M8MSK1_9BASI|nr:alpha beta-hydrolase [Malassezia pachydermatis]KOS12950.1 alpha beta-hydrolase [Malassezia pachydermatis]